MNTHLSDMFILCDGILNAVNISATKTFRTFRKLKLKFFRASMPPHPTTLLCTQKQFYPTNCGLIAKYSLGEQGMAQWWERSPPTNVARVQIPASTPYVGWVCRWFSPLLREVFLRVLRFSPLPKKPAFPNSNSTRNQVDEEPLCGCATSKSLFNLLNLFI